MKTKLHLIAVAAVLTMSGCDSVHHAEIASLATGHALTDVIAHISIRNTTPNYCIAIDCDRADASSLFGTGSPTTSIPCDIRVIITSTGTTVIDTNILAATIGSYAPPNRIKCNLLWFRPQTEGLYTLRVTENEPTQFFRDSSNCVITVSYLVPNGIEPRAFVKLRSIDDATIQREK